MLARLTADSGILDTTDKILIVAIFVLVMGALVLLAWDASQD